jgi:hypothetical protein
MFGILLVFTSEQCPAKDEPGAPRHRNWTPSPTNGVRMERNGAAWFAGRFALREVMQRLDELSELAT